MKKFLLILCLICAPAFAAENAPKTPAASEEIRTQVNALYAQNEINKAMELLAAIPDKTAHDYLLMGNILQDKGKNTDAAAMYKRATILDPKFYKAYYNLGVIYLEQNRPNLAAEELRKAVKLAPELAWAHYNLGCALFNTGETKQARREFERAVSLQNNVPDFHYNLAYTYKKLGNTKSAQKYLDFYNQLVR